MSKESDGFGEMFTRIVRDGSARYFDEIVAGETATPWFKNIQQALAQVDDETREMFKTVLMMVLDNTGFELLERIGEPDDEDLKIELKVNGQDILNEPEGLHEDTFSWTEKYSELPTTVEMLKKYGTTGWPRALLK